MSLEVTCKHTASLGHLRKYMNLTPICSNANNLEITTSRPGMKGDEGSQHTLFMEKSISEFPTDKIDDPNENDLKIEESTFSTTTSEDANNVNADDNCFVGEASFAKEQWHNNLTNSWLKVSDTLTFVQSGLEGSFHAKIKLENQTLCFVSYQVMSTCKPKFSFVKKQGVIPPNETAEVIVLTRLGEVKDFGDVCIEGFVIAATPVSYRSQLHEKKIRLFWEAYGTDVFPYNAAELHKINKIIPSCDAYMDKYCFIERAILGCFVAPRKLQSITEIRRNIPKKAFYNNWSPTEDIKDMKITFERQRDHVLRTVEQLRQDVESVNIYTKVVFSFFLMLFLLGICHLFFPFGTQMFGPNGNSFYQEEKNDDLWTFISHWWNPSDK